eukprot:gb/GECH01007844.1/.p1 GENE.gb/GECH01007844.1/~~gb/GECH01007844.1/.p1  ORF type:complete len:521 (+),score=84.35 gb/GECH01007844.1/:1-1563(+)
MNSGTIEFESEDEISQSPTRKQNGNPKTWYLGKNSWVLICLVSLALLIAIAALVIGSISINKTHFSSRNQNSFTTKRNTRSFQLTNENHYVVVENTNSQSTTLNLPQEYDSSQTIIINAVGTLSQHAPLNIQEENELVGQITSEGQYMVFINEKEWIVKPIPASFVHLVDGSVSSQKLASSAVHANNIAIGAVENQHLHEKSVGSSQISSQAVKPIHASYELLDLLYVCEIRKCSKCQQKREKFIEENPQLDKYVVGKCSSKDECNQVTLAGGFSIWNASKCDQVFQQDSNCGCCIQSISNLEKIPPEAASNVSVGTNTNEIRWTAQYLGMPPVEKYQISCAAKNDPNSFFTVEVLPHQESKKLNKNSGSFKCHIVADNNVCLPVISNEITIELEKTMSLDTNGVTVLCNGMEDGAVDQLNGRTFVKRNRTNIEKIIEEGEELHKLENTCTSEIVCMDYLFHDMSDFNSDISNWDTSRVVNMSNMFHRSSNFNQGIEYWDTSQVQDMSGMFFKASKFNQS